MTIADAITRWPIPYDTERGEEARALVSAPGGPAADLIMGAAGSSPYLAELVRKEAEWLSAALGNTAETLRAAILNDVSATEDANLSQDLRQAKRRIGLLTALADLGGIWPLETVTQTLTDFADLAVERALKAAVAKEIARGRLPGQGEGDVATAGGLSVLAMGKMGAGELNYSSDIDLICLFDETRFDPDDYADARASFVRAVRAMTRTLSDRTADGYVFRTDLRLRPDASVTPVAISMETAERYYESFGRTWERAAYIKARACAGDIQAGERFLKALTPFVWRRHLDFAAIQDAHDMRLRIRDHKGLHKAPSHLGHDMKLGSGGIREIEFFTQTRQIIAGGRDRDLRVRGTVEGLSRLAQKGWVDADVASMLADDYRAHRNVEHRIQMIADHQTHELPSSQEDFNRLACLAGEDPKTYASDIEERLNRVAKATEQFFAPGAKETAPPPVQLSDQAQEIVDRWAGYPALRSPRAVEIFNRVRPSLMQRLQSAARPEEALLHIDGFLSGLPAGVQLFSLFEANPHLLDLVVDVVDTAPRLGAYLARNAAVFDAVIGGSFFAEWPGVTSLRATLSAELQSRPDYEARLDRARVWAREWHFRIGVHHLRGLIGAEESGRQYADLAEAVVAALWPEVVQEFSRKHGPPPGAGATVLGMGSLGARRLNALSDLDLIVIYDGQGEEASDGPRPLATRPYYARLTQALVTALAAPTAEGRLYEVDMRLRPSGRQGPVATGLEAFRQYQTNDAWTWEHLALTRARVVAGSKELGHQVEAFRTDLLSQPRDRAKVLSDVADMRARLAAEKPTRHALDPKSGAGRLQDIELFAQAAALISGAPHRRLDDQLELAEKTFGLTSAEVAALKASSHLFWQVQAVGRLVSEGEMRRDDLGAGATAFLLRTTDQPSLDALEAQLDENARESKQVIDRIAGSA